MISVLRIDYLPMWSAKNQISGQAERLHTLSVLLRKKLAQKRWARVSATGFWKDLGVVNLASGRPTMALTGRAAQKLQEMTPAGMKIIIHLTLTDEFPFAQAQVLIEAVPC